jgi:arabinose-5-phosphate isomerase
MKADIRKKNDEEAGAEAARDIEKARAVFDDEIACLREVRDHLGKSFHEAVEAIFRCKGRLIVSGVGKSGLIGKKIAATLTSTGTPSFYLHPVEAVHGDLGLVGREDVVIFISKSGMSDELAKLLPPLRKLGVTIIALTGDRDSFLARNSHIILDTRVEHEAGSLGLAPTSSTTAALVMGDALASALIERRGFKVEDFARFHPSGVLGKKLTLTVGELMRRDDDIPVVRFGTLLSDALFEIINKRVGCTGVVDEEGRLTGIITDGDLKRILVKERDALKTPVEKVMTPGPKTIGADVLAADALGAMEFNPSGPITMFFVTDDEGRPVGLIHIHDILKAGLKV